MTTIRERCQDWSDESSHQEVSEFNPEWHDDYDLTEKEYIRAYYNVFVRVYKPSDKPSWRDAAKYWFVEVTGYVSEKDFEQYGVSGKAE